MFGLKPGKIPVATQASDRPGDRQFILPVIRAVTTVWPLTQHLFGFGNR
jgi:hypothetical protein